MDALVKLLMLVLLFAGLTWAIIAVAPFLAALIIGGIFYICLFEKDTDEKDS